MRLITNIFEYCAKNVPLWNTISISGYHIREAGSTAAQEIAFTIADGIAYVEAALKAGMDIDAFAGRLSFFWNAHNNVLEEVAKFRASRRVWAKVMKERFGAKKAKSMMLRVHTQTAGSMMFIGKHLLPTTILDADQEIEQEVEAGDTSVVKQMISAAILICVVLVMAVGDSIGLKGIVTLEMAAIMGAMVSVLSGCLTEKQAYASIDWVTIFLFAGMMPVSSAMDKTGAGKLIAEWTVGIMGGTPSPMVVTAILFILSCTLTQFMSNTASAALLCPIGVAISKQLGASPKAVLMAIAVAASCAFASPVGTPPNTLVLGPGGYKFMDYVKAGTGLVIVSFIVSLIVIPMVWPFFPGK